MPLARIIFYQEEPGRAPVVDLAPGAASQIAWRMRSASHAFADWQPSGTNSAAQRQMSLRDGIHELRAKKGRVRSRVLYFFSGQNAAVLDHALTRKGKSLDADIERAIRRKKALKRIRTPHL